ncbi:MAG: hypothetical protein ACKVS6_01345 [Planctomycetota bacterium]
MSTSQIRVDIKYALTHVAYSSGNQVDKVKLTNPIDVDSVPSGTVSSSQGVPQGDSLYVSSRIIVDDAWALERLPVLLREPPAGSLAMGQEVSIYYLGLLPLVSHCAYRVIINLAVPTDAENRPLPSASKTPADGRIILFEHKNFGGSYRVIDRSDGNLHLSHGGFVNQNTMGGPPGEALARSNGFMDEMVSSFIVASGHWRLFREPGFQLGFTNTKSSSSSTGLFGPGHYKDVTECGVADNEISSLLCEQL